VGKINKHCGFTLIEVVLVIVISGILVGVALRFGGNITETARVEETKQELDHLAEAVAGNQTLNNNGVRSDFGYVGDVGAMPPNLDALYSNPGSYATWNGPYISNRFSQTPDDYKTDAWGTSYSYTGSSITSTGSGGNIIRQVATSTDHLLFNSLSGNIYDTDGTPPGTKYKDSLSVRLTLPDGTGSTTTRTSTVGTGGFFSFDSVSIGNHQLEIIYLPDSDTLTRFVSVLPNSSAYTPYHLLAKFDFGITSTGGLSLVLDSDTLYADCNGVYFWIKNTSGTDIDISSVTLSWTGLAAYYRFVKWSTATVFDENNPRAGSGELSPFTSTQTITANQTLRVDFDAFKTNPIGGANVDINNITFTVDFSDGSEVTFATGACP
jgi:prepilin-type N-terminal cleavage/methylation domain-containing protein